MNALVQNTDIQCSLTNKAKRLQEAKSKAKDKFQANSLTEQQIILEQQIALENSWKRWLNPDDLYSIYGFSKSSQSKMRMASSNSTLPFSKIGKYIRYDRVEIDKWLESHQVQGEVA